MTDAQLRNELTEIKSLLRQVLTSVHPDPAAVALALQLRDREENYPAPPGPWGNDADIPLASIQEALARGDRSLLHRRNKARRKISQRQKQGVFK